VSIDLSRQLKKISHADDGVVAFAYLVLAVTFAIPFFPMPKDEYGYLSPSVLTFVFIVNALMFSSKKIFFRADRRYRVMAYTFALLVAVDYLAVILFNDTALQFKYASARAVQFMYFMAIASYLYNFGRGGFELLVNALVLSAVVISLLIILQGFGMMTIGNEASGRVLFGVKMPFNKATGTRISDGKLGTLLVPALVFTILSLRYPRELPVLGARVAAVLIPVGVVISQSRSMWLGAVVALFVIQFYLFKNKWHRRLSFLIYFSLIGTAFYFDIPQTIYQGAVSEGIYSKNVTNRLEGAYISLSQSAENMLYGVGKGAVKIVHDTGQAVVIHNMFLDQLVASGIIGLAPLAFLFAYPPLVLLRYMSALQRTMDRQRFVFAVGMFVVLLDVLVEVNLYRAYYNEYLPLYLAMSAFVISRVAFNRTAVKAPPHNPGPRPVVGGPV